MADRASQYRVEIEGEMRRLIDHAHSIPGTHGWAKDLEAALQSWQESNPRGTRTAIMRALQREIILYQAAFQPGMSRGAITPMNNFVKPGIPTTPDDLALDIARAWLDDANEDMRRPNAGVMLLAVSGELVDPEVPYPSGTSVLETARELLDLPLKHPEFPVDLAGCRIELAKIAASVDAASILVPATPLPTVSIVESRAAQLDRNAKRALRTADAGLNRAERGLDLVARGVQIIETLLERFK